ncbi:hypothetical protein SAMN05216185_1227 [Pseudomonas guariconensis]|nr:hypothetical protein SAMN05216185_1227 [Pseudomonas guariconensis]
MSFDFGNKDGWLTLQGSGQLEDDGDRRLVHASFDETDIVPLDIGFERQLLLRKTSKLAPLA